MLARYGAAGCILAIVILVLLAAFAGENAREVIRAVGPYFLLAMVAAVYLAGESRDKLRAIFVRSSYARRGAAASSKHGANDGADTLDEQIVVLGNVLKFARAVPVIDHLEPINVPDLVAEVAERQNDVRIEAIGSKRRILTLASREAVRRALEILVANALVNASRVTLACDSGTSALVVHVDDNGPGVPKSLRGDVLEWRYHMAAPSLHPACLADVVIARQIAKAHGGDVVAGCSPLGGARFSLRLPLANEAAFEVAAAS